MDKNFYFLKHPYIFVYIIGSIIILFSIWLIGDNGEKEGNDLNLPKSSITKFDVGLPDTDWRLMGFVNAYKTQGQSDLIYLRDNEISTYRYFNKIKRYQKYQSIFINLNNKNDVVHEITPIDWNGKGYNDLMIICRNGSGIYNALILKNENGEFNGDLIDLKIRSKTIPFIFDFSHDLIDDILYLDADLNKWKLYKKQKEFLNDRNIYGGFGVAQLTDKNGINFIAKTENSTTKTEFSIFEFKNNNWKLLYKFNAPPLSGEIAIADFDKNGLLDIVFPVYPKGGDSYLCYMFNSKNGFKNDTTCSNKDSSIKLIIPNIIKDIKPQVNDITLDGYPSIALGIQDKNGVSTQLILNQQCKNCGTREIIPVIKTDLILPGLGGFFDVFQDGSIDFITNKGSFISTLAEKSFFLKATALNELCLGKCKKHSKIEHLSSIYNGATFHIFYTDKQGFKHNSTCVQHATSGMSEQYCIFGLGENVHYVEELTVVSYDKTSYRWILPDSFIFSATEKHYRIFLHYQIQGFYVLLCFVALLLILGLFVLIYSQKEDAEDRKEADEMLPIF